MTEDQSYRLPPGDNNLSDSAVNDEVTGDCYYFNKYEPYIERIRTLFVPSLEPRIHSCLETFVYRQEFGQGPNPPYLKRCLDAAATLRDPVEAFCTKWRDSGFLETMLTSVVKFLVSNGPIDCFLNSIILNNRLNKVCRDLDALGGEKDLLRYLAVWNYINERDYWLEEDQIISASKSDESRDSADRLSDLDVEVGSGLDSRRNDRSFRRAFKRRATDDSSDDKDRSGRVSQNLHETDETRVPFPSRLSIDSSNPEGSRSSSARKKIRSCQAHPCRAATCPSYRAKNSPPVNWEGKTLKLHLCETSHESLDRRRESRRSSQVSELHLPCKFDDLVAEIFKAHPTSSRRFFAQGRRKFKAGVTSVCSRVNETVGKIGRKEIERCRLHCEILPGCVSFRLIERDRDGSEVCLLSDRVPIDRIDPRQDNSRSSGSEPRRIGERNNADGSELTIYKNYRFSPAQDESRIVRSFEEETAIKTEPENFLISLSDVEREATARKNVEQSIEHRRRDGSNRSSEDKAGKSMCGCNTSFDDQEAYRRKEDNYGGDSEPKSHPRESTEARSLSRLDGSAIVDELDRPAMNGEDDEAANRNNEELAGGEASMCSNGNLIEVQKCACSVSFHAGHPDLAIGEELFQAAVRQASVVADLSEEIADLALEDAEEKDRRAKAQRDGPTDKDVKKNPAEECDSKCSCDSCGREDEARLMEKTEITRMSSLPNRIESLDSAVRELPVPDSSQRIGGLVPASDELQGECTGETRPEECDSKCSCGTCCEDEPQPLKKTEIIRMSSLLTRRTDQNSVVQDSRNKSSTQKNEASTSASDESECGCAESRSSSHSHDLKFREGPPIKSGRPLDNNVPEAMSFIDAESQRAQPTIQRASSTKKSRRSISSEEHPFLSARLSPIEHQSGIPTDNQPEKTACACPSDCTCPNRATEANNPEECDSQCSCDSCREDESRPLKKTEIIRMSSLLRPLTETLNSFQDLPDPTSTLKNGSFLVPTSDDFQRGCSEAQPSSFRSQDHEPHAGPSTKSDSPLKTNTAKKMVPLIAEPPLSQPDRTSLQRTSPTTDKTRRKMSSEEHPIVASRSARSKGQRINISIEVCPESASSSERTRKKETANEELEVRKDAIYCRKPRRHSLELRPLEEQVLPHSGEDTVDEFLEETRLTDVDFRSPPRPLESPNYFPPFRPPSSMRNPIVYGTSTKSRRRSISNMEERAASQGGKRGGDSCVTKNRHASIQRKNRINENENPRESRRPSKPDAFYSSGLQTNVPHALSASSVDRMKHLIRTKLRRMLLERDKATNTPKTTLTNKKYRVSVPGAKTDRLFFGNKPCRTIWESRSASDSVRTSRSLTSDDCKNAIGIREETRKLARSSRAGCGGGHRRFDGANSSRNSEPGRRVAENGRAPEFGSGTNFPRLAGGSDFMHPSGKRENRCTSQNKNDRFDENFMNRGFKGVPVEIGDSSAGNSREASGKKIADESVEFSGIQRVGEKEREREVDSEINFPTLSEGSDSSWKHRHLRWSGKKENRGVLNNKNSRIDTSDENLTDNNFRKFPEEIGDPFAQNSCDATRKRIPDDSSEFYRKLDCCGNSTSRHIYLFEFDRLVSSNDETNSVGFRRSPRKTRLPEIRRTPRRNVDAHPKKLIVSRAHDSRLSSDRSALRDTSAISDYSSNVKDVGIGGVRRVGPFANIDQDLRKKLTQYVNLCKNVKYSLLKRLRPDDIYEVSRTSIPCCDRYEFGDT